MPPPTPLFEGIPACQAQPPEPSYKSGHGHRGENVGDVFALDYLLARFRIVSVVGERRAHPRELDRVHPYRTLLGVDVDRFKRIGVDALVFREQHRESFVARIGRRFRLIDLFDERQASRRDPAVKI